MIGHPPTPVLSQHARDRCQEMGISTKVAKRIHKTMSLTWEGRPGTTSRLGFSDEVSEYGIVYAPSGNPLVPDIIVSVIFRTDQQYIRQGNTYTVVGEGA